MIGCDTMNIDAPETAAWFRFSKRKLGVFNILSMTTAVRLSPVRRFSNPLGGNFRRFVWNGKRTGRMGGEEAVRYGKRNFQASHCGAFSGSEAV